MFPSDSDLILSIVVEAISLLERLDQSAVSNTQTYSETTHKRLTRWRQVVARDDSMLFNRRLCWDGRDFVMANSALSRRDPLLKDLPEWAATLMEVIVNASGGTMGHDSSIDHNQPLPFEDILLPAVIVARTKLHTRLGDGKKNDFYSILSVNAQRSLERALLTRLSNCCSLTLLHEFQRIHVDVSGRYPLFVKNLFDSGLRSFFCNYPVLGRLIATIVDSWVNASEEFIRRLVEDLPTIIRIFVPTHDEILTNLGVIEELVPDLGDPHHGGRSVVAVTFTMGLKLVYKPRNLAPEIGFNKLLDWCNHRMDSCPRLRVLQILDCGTHGWMEFVEPMDCVNLYEVERFYQRVGMLLAIVSALGATDIHQDNLIASGEHLFLVDAETIMHPQPQSLDPVAAFFESKDSHLDAVLQTAMLPFTHERSGLKSQHTLPLLDSRLRWKAINTDHMRCEPEKTADRCQNYLPHYRNEGITVDAYVLQLIDGFSKIWRFFMQERSTLLGANGPLEIFRGQRVRFVFRSTRIYGLLSYRSLSPRFLGFGLDRSIELELLYRALLNCNERPIAWPIVREEIQCLERLDIPRFSVETTDTTLQLGNQGSVTNYLEESGFDRMARLLLRQNEINLAQQIAVIHATLCITTKSTTDILQYGSTIRPTVGEGLLAAAAIIAQRLRERAIICADGSANWIGFRVTPAGDRFTIEATPDNLYHGRCGIALFLAAFDRSNRSDQHRDLIMAAIRPARCLADGYEKSARQQFATRFGIGAAVGIASIIYSLVKISEFLDDNVFIEDALRITRLITAEVIAADPYFDITAGTAGAILGLLALYSNCGENTVLATAELCGRHLLSVSSTNTRGIRQWKSLGNGSAIGFAHGSTGIAYALTCLGAVCGNTDFLVAGQAILADENCIVTHDERAGDVSEKGNEIPFPVHTVSWCHGITGIALGRLAAFTSCHTSACNDIPLFLTKNKQFSWDGPDHLCCGNFGRIELSVVAAEKLVQPIFKEEASSVAAALITRASIHGGYFLHSQIPRGAFVPGFFRGESGIGYQLLRLASPIPLPSILLWE
ncbi:LanM family lanthionine synthetase [Gammaproteobacteria bacterium]